MADPADGGLAFPPAALHHSELLHPDSIEAVRRESIRTAKELDPISEQPHPHPHPLQGAHGPQDAMETDSRAPAHLDRRKQRVRRQRPRWYDGAKSFWTSHVSLTIDEGSHRDHLALERTFLGYLRTSVAFAMTGVVISQLFRLQHTIDPNLKLGFFVLGVPLSATFIGFAMLVLLVGALRFWRQQGSMVRGKVQAGGWEISIVMGMSILVSIVLFMYLLLT